MVAAGAAENYRVPIHRPLLGRIRHHWNAARLTQAIDVDYGVYDGPTVR